MNANLLVRISTFLKRISLTYSHLRGILFFFFLTFGYQAYADTQPILIVFNPPKTVCAGSTVNLADPSVTAGSDADIIFAYYSVYTDAIKTPLVNLGAVPAGTYYVHASSLSRPSLSMTYDLIITELPAAMATLSGTTTVCQNATAPNITFTNPQTLPIVITYNINGANQTTINVNASSSATIAAPTTIVGAFTYNLVSVAYQSAPTCPNAISGTATVTVNQVPAQPSAIAGSILTCQGSSQTYSVANVDGVIYTWTFPAGWLQTAGGTKNSVIVTVGANPGTVQVTPSNSCGNGTVQTLTVTLTTVPAQPSAITGNATPCQTSSQTFSVINVAEVTYMWTFPAGWSQTAGGTTNTVTVTVGAGSGSVQVTPSNTCGNGTVQTLAVTPTTVPVQPDKIAGNPTPCQTTSQVYSVTNVVGVNYNWTFPAGWSQTAGGTTNSVTVTVGAGSGNVQVTPSNACGNGTAQTLGVAPTTVPAQPSVITGSSTPCQTSSQTYSVINVAGVTYTWSFPAGWTQSGGTTNSVTVTVGTGSGNIQVTPSNTCGNGTAQSLAVTTTAGVPAQPSAITGDPNPCQTSSQIYSVTNVVGVNYTWSFPAGWVQTGGGTANSVTVTVGSGSGNVQVTPSNSCGNGTVQTFAVTVDPTGTVTGGSSICSGSTSGVLTLTGNAGVILRWQSSVSPFSTWTDTPILNTSATYNPGVLTETTQFRVVVKSGLCPEVFSASATVTIAQPFDLAFIPTNPSKSGESDGKIDAIVTGGTEPKYLWTGPAPLIPNDSKAIINLKFGKYFLTVTDKNGCSQSGQQTLNDPPHAFDDTTYITIQKGKDLPYLVNWHAFDQDGKIDTTTLDLNPNTAKVDKYFNVDNKGIFYVEWDINKNVYYVYFKPLPDYYGSVSLKYVVSDNSGSPSNVGTMTVIARNFAPIAKDHSYIINEHEQLMDNVLTYDYDPDGFPLRLVSFKIKDSQDIPTPAGKSLDIPNKGTIVINADGKFVFTPHDKEHFFGNVSIDYTIVDIEGLTASATLYITVNPVGDPPVAVNDKFESGENTKVEENVLVPNPTDPDSDPKNLELITNTIPVQSPAHGKVVLSANGDFVYEPLNNFIGTDSFVYQICNSLTPPLCATATVTIVIGDSCKVFVPSVFSPNGDGIHDYFEVKFCKTDPTDNPEMQIFNRNGNLIFKKDHYGDPKLPKDQAFWNGRSQNKMNVINDELPVGTYYYIFKLGNGQVLTGFVFLAK